MLAFLKYVPKTGCSPPAHMLAMPSRVAGLPHVCCTGILFIKPCGVLILSNGTTLLIHAHFLIHNNHQILWAELLLSYLFLLFTGH